MIQKSSREAVEWIEVYTVKGNCNKHRKGFVKVVKTVDLKYRYIIEMCYAYCGPQPAFLELSMLHF